MRTSRFTLLRRSLTLLAIVGLLLFPASSAFAAGAGAVSITQTFHNAIQTMPAANPCTGDPGMVTITYNGVAHATFLTSGVGAGTGWETFTATGDFVFTPNDLTKPTFTGNFTAWDGENINLQNFAATAIFVLHGTGSDGSTLTFHDVAHFSVSASGVTISFDKPTCG